MNSVYEQNSDEYQLLNSCDPMPMSKTLMIMNKIDFLGAHVYEPNSDDIERLNSCDPIPMSKTVV